MIELNGIQISDNNINTKKNVKIYTDEKQLSNVVDKEVHALKGVLKDLHTPIAISTENTTESKAQNVRNITDFVAKAKAAGIADVNGMAVTCLIDNGDSGVGNLYLFGDGSYLILCIATLDDLSGHYIFRVNSVGEYTENSVVVNNINDQITSQMLTQGARKPIILTPETTEVDEETYQKLLSDDVDVILKDNDFISYLCEKYDDGNKLRLSFQSYTVSEDTLDASDFSFDRIGFLIDKSSPHTIERDISSLADFEQILNYSGYLKESTLSPVLQEIDLTGTDADRKAKLDQFETDWKDLTGTDDILGARFVGYMGTPSGELSTIFAWNSMSSFYEGVGTDDVGKIYKIQVNPSAGNIHLTPLFSHLEPVEIFFDNTAEKKKKNLDNLNAYKSNLEQLGVDTTNGYQVPIETIDADIKTGGVLFYSPSAGLYTPYRGLLFIADDKVVRYFAITPRGEVIEEDNLAFSSTLKKVTTLAQALKDLHTPVPLTATASTNKTQLDLFLSKVPNAQVMHCIYKDVYAGTLHKIGTDWFGLLVKNTNNYEDALQVKLQADGTLIEGTTSLAQVNAKLDTIMG